MAGRISRASAYISTRIWPLLVGFGSAVVMGLAFFVPSIQDQWDRYESRKVIKEYERMGDEFYAEGKFELAEAAYTKIIDISPSMPLEVEVKRLDARVSRMSTMVNWGDTLDTDLEEVDFQFLLHLRDQQGVRRARVLNAFGMYLARNDRTDEAKACYAEAIELAPANELFRINYGNLLDQLGRKKEAEVEYLLAIELAPENPWAKYDLALLYAEAGDTTKAIALMKAAAVLEPSDTAIANRITDLTDPR